MFSLSKCYDVCTYMAKIQCYDSFRWFDRSECQTTLVVEHDDLAVLELISSESVQGKFEILSMSYD